MTTPAMTVLRAQYPAAQIVVLANPLVAELFKVHPAADRVIVYDKKGCHRGLKGLWRLTQQLRQERFDAAVLLQNAIEAALIAWLAGIPRRAGYTTDGRRLLLNYPVTLQAADKRRHHTDYYLHLLQQLGLTFSQSVSLSLQCSASERQWARQQLGGVSPIAVNPGAAYGSAKRWLPERFAAVADALAEQCHCGIVLTGGPGEHEIGAEIEAAMTAKPINLIGKTSVRQMMAVLAESRLLVTNDSGPMHVAAAFDVPIVAVFGSTDHTTTSPASDRVRIVRKPFDCAPCLKRQCPTDHRCMLAIEADEVIAAALEVLEQQQDVAGGRS
ncbi:MAG: lipopolysaccharide heptosyltransferase II [Desulfuromonadaceae bacterium]|nr:lipopolysaccharide heptosyltransferase II [Desulfuromonadaceae bacterium]